LLEGVESGCYQREALYTGFVHMSFTCRKIVRHRRGSRRAVRVRRTVAPGRYEVTARVERFAEPAVLLLLRGRPAHGYELLEQPVNVRSDRTVRKTGFPFWVWPWYDPGVTGAT
jgi:hypothetical protein